MEGDRPRAQATRTAALGVALSPPSKQIEFKCDSSATIYTEMICYLSALPHSSCHYRATPKSDKVLVHTPS
jgi:hypothetical protein